MIKQFNNITQWSSWPWWGEGAGGQVQEDADDVAEEQCGGRVREDTEAELDHEAGEEDTDSNYDRMEEVDCEEMLPLHCGADNNNVIRNYTKIIVYF